MTTTNVTTKKLSDLLEMMGVGARSPQGAGQSESIPTVAALAAPHVTAVAA
ncbi:hypothetical protein AB0M48_05185 [Lentzea sp. NPDC051208]|uniref:hypothetical protein n=1 Tax=Lentzea sp. NPDC051208 TaxID=3154642 RepID=UPI003437EA2F